jgi:hypothetical protein
MFKMFFISTNYQEIKDRLVKFFESTVKENISQSSYIIDFFVGKEKIYIIELNPFHSGAGPGLFSWSKDRQILFGGPLEFRFNHQKKEGDISSIQMEKFLIKKYGFLNISGHETFKKESKNEKKSDNNFFLLLSILFLLISFFVLYKIKF